MGAVVSQASCNWVRDEYISHNGQIWTTDEMGSFAIGGVYVQSPNFILAPESLKKSANFSTEQIAQLISELYIVPDVFFLPDPDFLDQHLDRQILVIPERELIVIDQHYYRRNRTAVSILAEVLGYTLRTVPRRTSLPANSIPILDHDKNLRIVTGVESLGALSPLRPILREFDIQGVEVPFAWISANGGSVRCFSNSLPHGVWPEKIVRQIGNPLPQDQIL